MNKQQTKENILPATLDNSLSANINIKWLIQIVFFFSAAVWFYAEISERLDFLEHNADLHKIEIKQNSEFRIKWPRGELGALPDDAEQNIRLNYLEKEMEKLEDQLDELEDWNEQRKTLRTTRSTE